MTVPMGPISRGDPVGITLRNKNPSQASRPLVASLLKITGSLRLKII
jgi:hypothetical protein